MEEKVSTKNHSERIKSELVKAGMTKYGLVKGESRHLPGIIHNDEHIFGVVYGRAANKGSAMLVATNKRVLYLDHRIFFNKSDELSYDVVSGVSYNEQGSYAGVVLHTRLGDFGLRFVNLKAAKKFVAYVEKRQVETNASNNNKKADVVMPAFAFEDTYDQAQVSQKARIFLITHEVATLSTIDDDGRPHGAVVYYAVDKQNYLYIVTKDKTKKARHISKRPFVAMTMVDTSSMQTMQIDGVAHVETDPTINKRVYDTILRPRFDGSHAEMPPIMYLPAGNYEVIVIKITHYKLSDYKTQR